MGSLVCGLTAALTLSGTAPAGERPFLALINVLTVAVPIAVGLAVWHLRPRNRFGPLLIAAGFAWSLTTLAQSDSSLLYSVGRVSLWAVEPAVLYFLLAFPSGRLLARADKLLVLAAVAIAALLFLPTAFLVESYPRNSPLAACDTDCPANFFMLADSTPGFVDSMRDVREILIVLVFVAAAVRLMHRITHATRLMRRTMTPVLAAAVARLGAYAAFLPARRAAPDSPAVEALGLLVVLTLPLIAVGFLVGFTRWRLHVAGAMEQLARKVMARPNRVNLRAAMGEALEDPSLEVAYWAGDGHGKWVNADGVGIDVERRAGRERGVTTFSDNGRPAVALLHDPVLSEHRDFVEAVASVAVFATENERLTARLRASLRDLEHSRTRLVAAADRERHRIERDLHDGAQQRLVAMRIKLEIAEELLDTDAPHARKLLHEVESEVDEALDEVRSLARGIYPSLLVDRGLPEALRAVALRAPLPVSVKCEGVARYPAEVESAVYFSCLEALQNAVKHARGATALNVSVCADGELRFEVRDDGAGFEVGELVLGQGVTNMRDRLAAVGGRLSVHSSTGEGTVVRGTVPASAMGPDAASDGDGGRRAPPPTHMRTVWRPEPQRDMMKPKSGL
jgi:signal transduction histidine kinase